MLGNSDVCLILASASPRRRDLLRQIGVVPTKIIASNLDETVLQGEHPRKYVQRMAAQKAKTVAADNPEAVILAADTIVLCRRQIIGKPHDAKQAQDFITMLSGRRHRVITSVCVLRPSAPIMQKTVTTIVKFRNLPTAEIEQYIKTGQWQGKAGAYAIQELAGSFVPWINGSYSNIVGLPLAETKIMLQNAGVIAI